MKIQIPQLPQGHSRMERREPAGPFDLEEWLRPRGPVEVDLDAERRGDQITLRGRVGVDADQDCARCAREFTFRVEAEVLVFADRRGSDVPEDEVALEQEGDVLYHDGIELDLDGPLREALILEVPVVQLCRPDCRGLCPHCGQDLNEGPCGCTPPTGDPRWEGLKALKDKTS